MSASLPSSPAPRRRLRGPDLLLSGLLMLSLSLLVSAVLATGPAGFPAPAAAQVVILERDRDEDEKDSGEAHRATEIIIDEDGIRIEGHAVEEDETFDEERDWEWEDRGKGKRRISVTTRTSDIVRFGECVEVGPEEVVAGDVVVIGGTVDVYGKVSGDVVAVGGAITLHEGSVVNGEAVAVGGQIIRKEGSEVHGETVAVDIGIPFPMFIARGCPIVGPWGFPGLGWLGSLISCGVSLAVLVGIAALLVLIFGTQIGRMSAAVRQDIVKTGLIGLLALVAVPGICVLLCVTIIGIPAAFILFLVWLLALLFGLIAVAMALGGRLAGAINLGESPFLLAIVGVLVLCCVSCLGSVFCGIGPLSPLGLLISFLGILIVGVASTIGLGAVVTTRFGGRRPTPPAPSAPATPSGPSGPSMGGAPPAGEVPSAESPTEERPPTG